MIPAKVSTADSIFGLHGDPQLSRRQFLKPPFGENKGPGEKLMPAARAS